MAAARALLPLEGTGISSRVSDCRTSLLCFSMKVTVLGFPPPTDKDLFIVASFSAYLHVLSRQTHTFVIPSTPGVRNFGSLFDGESQKITSF